MASTKAAEDVAAYVRTLAEARGRNVALARFLSAIAHPQLAYLLLTLGLLGLAVELWNPGAIAPGVAGGLCLLLVVFGMALSLAGMLLFVGRLALESQRRPPVTGVQGLIGEEGRARTALRPGDDGQIDVRGEIWRAAAAVPINMYATSQPWPGRPRRNARSAPR